MDFDSLREFPLVAPLAEFSKSCQTSGLPQGKLDLLQQITNGSSTRPSNNGRL
jgi:hypothetical protein